MEWVIFCLLVWRGYINIFLKVVYYDIILLFIRFLGKINRKYILRDFILCDFLKLSLFVVMIFDFYWGLLSYYVLGNMCGY